MSMKLLKRASSSLMGHVALFESFFSLPLSLIFLRINYLEGTLTPLWALRVILVSAVGGVIPALVLWYTVTSPLVKRRKGGS
jgi:hypothetical protein